MPSFLGSFDGLNVIVFPLDLVLVVGFSLLVFWYSQRVILPPDRAKQYIDQAAAVEAESAQQ